MCVCVLGVGAGTGWGALKDKEVVVEIEKKNLAYYLCATSIRKSPLYNF